MARGHSIFLDALAYRGEKDGVRRPKARHEVLGVWYHVWWDQDPNIDFEVASDERELQVVIEDYVLETIDSIF